MLLLQHVKNNTALFYYSSLSRELEDRVSTEMPRLMISRYTTAKYAHGYGNQIMTQHCKT